MASPKYLLLSGSSGKVGQALFFDPVHSAAGLSSNLIPILRDRGRFVIPESYTSLPRMQREMATLVHMATGLHRWSITKDVISGELNAFRSLIERLASKGLRRVVLFSSAKVYGPGVAKSSFGFSEADPVNPTCLYGRGKVALECEIEDLSKAYDIDYITLRLPPIYSSHIDNNLSLLIRLVSSGLPLPSSHAKFSLLSADNLRLVLCEIAAMQCLSGRVLNVSDDSTLSCLELTDMVDEFYQSRRSRIIPIHSGSRALLVRIPFIGKKFNCYFTGTVLSTSLMKDMLPITLPSSVRDVVWKFLEGRHGNA